MENLQLPPDLEVEINGLWDQGSDLAYYEKFQELKNLMTIAWDKFPEEPKINYDLSFWISCLMCEALINLREFDLAQNWVEIFKTADLNRMESGDRDFMEGRLAFSMESWTKAKECFTISNQKSKGRCWKKKGTEEYFEFFKNGTKGNIRPTNFDDMLNLSLKEINKKNYSYSLDLLYDCLNIELDNSIVHFNKGLCHFELNELDHAADSFTRAYMLEGEDVFKEQGSKYFDFLKTRIEIK